MRRRTTRLIRTKTKRHQPMRLLRRPNNQPKVNNAMQSYNYVRFLTRCSNNRGISDSWQKEKARWLMESLLHSLLEPTFTISSPHPPIPRFNSSHHIPVVTLFLFQYSKTKRVHMPFYLLLRSSDPLIQIRLTCHDHTVCKNTFAHTHENTHTRTHTHIKNLF